MTRERHDGTKRGEILAAATQRFGRDGYEHTKWADVAADVGVGPTALYHYFESKQHCLYVIMDEADRGLPAPLRRDHRADAGPARGARRRAAGLLRPDRAGRPAQPRARLRAGAARASAGRRRARRRPASAARARARELEFAWASFLAERDARRRDARERPAPADAARSSGSTTASGSGTGRTASMALRPIARLLPGRTLAMIGIAPDGVTRPRMVGHDVLRAVLRAPRRPRPAQLAGARGRGRGVLDPVGRRRRPPQQPVPRRPRGAARVHRRRRHRRAGRITSSGAATDGDVEFALGETRWDESGERIGTFLAVAQLDDDGRMRRYMVARTPALGFPQPRSRRDAGSA